MRKGYSVAVASIIAIILLFACGGHKQPAPVDLRVAPASGTVQDALAQLDALSPPDGVEPSLFEELKQEFTRQLNGYHAGKLTCSPPNGEANKVVDLGLTPSGSRDFTLNWHYRNLGDYDQNGTVGISDITPLAVHFGETYDQETAPDCIQAVIDGSGNGVVDIADVTPIAVNFGVNSASYRIEGRKSASGPFDFVEDASLYNAAGDGRLEFAVSLEDVTQFYYRVVPQDSWGATGIPSDPVALPGGAPTVESVSPTSGLEGECRAFRASVTGGTAIEYSWDFGGGAEPNTSNEVKAVVTLANAGVHNASVTVSNPLGEDTFEFELQVTASMPQIQFVMPTIARKYQTVQFIAYVIGSPPLTYSWDFGGGANPNESTHESPLVFLLDVGEYDASLTVTNSLGEDVYEFTLILTEDIPFPFICNVEPTFGYAGEYVNFTATVEGTEPLSYEWDFGGGAEPDYSSSSSPTVQLGAPGQYYGELYVSNILGDYDEFSFRLNVLDYPLVTLDGRVVYDENETVGIPDMLVELLDEYEYFEPGVTDSEGYYEIPDVPIGSHTVKPTTSGWVFYPRQRIVSITEEMHTVNFQARKTDWHVRTAMWQGSSGAEYPESSLAVVGGRPAVCYRVATVNQGEALRFRRAGDSDGLDWNTPSIIVANTVPPLSVGRSCSLAVFDSRPAIGCAGSPNYYRAKDSIGIEWELPVDVAQDTTANWTSLLVVSGNPAVTYYDTYGGQAVRFARATNAQGSSPWGEPVLLHAGNLGSTSVRAGFAIIGGYPAVSFPDPEPSPDELKFVRAFDASGSAWGAPVAAVSLNASMAFTPLAEVGGRAAIVYRDGAVLKCVRATDAEGSSWGTPVEVMADATYVLAAVITFCDGKPAVAVTDSSDIRFIISDDATGSHWGEPLLVDWYASGSGASLSAAVVNGHAAVCYYDDDRGELLYAVYLPE